MSWSVSAAASADSNRNELWDHESNHSLGSYLPPQRGEYDSRPPSAYGGYDNYGPNSRGISPAASYKDLRPGSTFEPPQLPYNGNMMGSPMSGAVHLPGDNRSMYGGSAYGDARSGYGGSFYGHPAQQYRGSTYSLAATGPPGFDPRASSYSLIAPQQPPFDQRVSSYSFHQPDPQAQAQAASRTSSYSFAQPAAPAQAPPPASRPVSNFLGDLSTETAPISLGAEGITDAQLEGSIRRICAGADLDNLTKKGVRKQLEEEYEVGLGGRKESINRIIEQVLAGECFLCCVCACWVRS